MASRMGTAIREAGSDQHVVAYLRADYWSRGMKTTSARESKAKLRDEIWEQLNEEQRAIAGRLASYIRVRR